MNGKTATPTFDMDRVRKIGAALSDLCAEIDRIFPGRSGLIHQTKFALLTRHHQLVTGPYGTAKTDFCNTLFGQITGAQKSSYALSKFSNEAQVFGMPNMRVLQEDSRLEYDVVSPDTIFQSQFIEFDEFLDANTPVLRAMLGLLNERVWKRGRQFAECKLHTAVASTNESLKTVLQNDPKLGAVIDRFLFHSEVSYLEDKASRLRMYDKYLKGAKPTTQIEYQDLAYISELVLDANQITDVVILEAYDDVVQEFVSQTRIVVSDRRRCKVLQLLEANALLYGRINVVPEDILAAKWGLCSGDDKSSQDLFDNLAQEHIHKANDALGQDVGKLQFQLLDKCCDAFDKLKTEQVTDDNYVNINKELNRLRKEVSGVQPELESIRNKQVDLLGQFDQFETELKKFVGGN